MRVWGRSEECLDILDHRRIRKQASTTSVLMHSYGAMRAGAVGVGCPGGLIGERRRAAFRLGAFPRQQCTVALPRLRDGGRNISVLTRAAPALAPTETVGRVPIPYWQNLGPPRALIDRSDARPPTKHRRSTTVLVETSQRCSYAEARMTALFSVWNLLEDRPWWHIICVV